MNQEYEKGVQLYNAEQYREAEKSFLKSIHEDPTDALSYNKLGLVYTKMGRYSLAKESFNNALVNDSQLVSAWNNLGNIARQENKLEEAKEYYSKGLEIESDNPVLQRNIRRVEKLLKISPSQIFRTIRKNFYW